MASRDSPGVQGSMSLEGASAARDDFVDRLRAGDPDALERMAREEAPRVARLLGSILGPRAELEDLVQTVFLEACRALPRFRGDSSVSTFIGGITVRVARRAMRPSAWTRLRSTAPAEPVLTIDPEQSARASAQLRRLHRALSSIGDKKRVAFLLWSLEGMDVESIAELTDASVSATKSRIFHAQRELKRIASKDPALREVLEGGADGR
jgi:RNA polymerase sigma-70 factor (ECF subfamily)